MEGPLGGLNCLPPVGNCRPAACDPARRPHPPRARPPARLSTTWSSLAHCARLVSEQEVQALSTDAATANVEPHYAYICAAFSDFAAKYGRQHAAHAGACGGAAVVGLRGGGGKRRASGQVLYV